MLLNSSIWCPVCGDAINYVGEVEYEWHIDKIICKSCKSNIKVSGYVELTLDCAIVAN